MPISGDLYEFTPQNVDGAPEQHGVYELRLAETTVYIGRASGGGVTIRSRLQSHLRGHEGRCTRNATHYRREVTDAATARERELLQEFASEHNGRLPECNEVRT